MRDQRIRSAIHRRVQHHFIVGIGELGAPGKANFDRLNGSRKRGESGVYRLGG
jgi:hypothetical protein